MRDIDCEPGPISDVPTARVERIGSELEAIERRARSGDDAAHTGRRRAQQRRAKGEAHRYDHEQYDADENPRTPHD